MRQYKFRRGDDSPDADWVTPNPRLTGYNIYGEPTSKLRPKVGELKAWLKWMRGCPGGGKGFVVIDGLLYRHCNPRGFANVKETISCHKEDIGYKWNRYFSPVAYTKYEHEVFEQLDIKHRSPEEQKRIIRGFIEAENRRAK